MKLLVCETPLNERLDGLTEGSDAGVAVGVAVGAGVVDGVGVGVVIVPVLRLDSAPMPASYAKLCLAVDRFATSNLTARRSAACATCAEPASVNVKTPTEPRDCVRPLKVATVARPEYCGPPRELTR
ncbi:MAG: hypothetical protein DLM53_10295 [Candidatus Eremiobacter antarcticus]|nr:MAG: hypothetical protein DLM53_10295 [Candidatus Eremiobacter sp. RRmetagenome_bin22]